MRIEDFLQGTEQLGISFYTGVPDSKLSALCDNLYMRYGSAGSRHVVAANEGGAVGLAAGHYIATGAPALVYLQNSGLGNILNPVVSLLSDKVYGIPCVFVIGWRGEPGIADEPQHTFQGEITMPLLRLLNIEPFILTKETDSAAFSCMLYEIGDRIRRRQLSAFVVREGAFSSAVRPSYSNIGILQRERALEMLLLSANRDDIMVSTTGKTSREVYELRKKHAMGHSHDFLTVGSMGHASMIALGIARGQPERIVYCLDGDGALLMHMGALAVEGVCAQSNFVHVLLNNGAHESVGGMPTPAGSTSFIAMARSCGFTCCLCATSEKELQEQLLILHAKAGKHACFLEIKLARGSRPALGRPATTPDENVCQLMQTLQEKP